MTAPEESSFSFDQVVNVDNFQSVHAELLQPLADSMSAGYNGALLICGVPTERTCSLIDHSIIKQLLAELFSRIWSQVKEESLISVSFLQFYPDGSAVDVLSPNRQTLKLVTHPVLGRCSFLFSVAVEWKLHREEEEEEEEEICRSRLQLFTLAGGASSTDLRGVSPLVKVVDQISSGASTADQLLPLLLHEALTGNSRAVLIYCINLQGLLDYETPSSLALAQKVRGLVNKATVGRWSPRAAEREIREEIMTLQNMMMSQGGREVQNTHRLAELTHHLQIVKNQSWDRRRDESKKIKSKTQERRQTPNRNWHISDHRQETDKKKHLQDQLKLEMQEHIRGNVPW
ncbi:uncharacterized protein LOC128445610 [Pleuronectes platessa]|uniref:uncharacterized protein LOC128445610 n=1 Tax=Pleuronectes platessa TaxID=8262 RepID=UPI00232A468E|nr:uncharacterized protein LOC128445610 [Pleuronectes platessa]